VTESTAVSIAFYTIIRTPYRNSSPTKVDSTTTLPIVMRHRPTRSNVPSGDQHATVSIALLRHSNSLLSSKLATGYTLKTWERTPSAQRLVSTVSVLVKSSMSLARHALRSFWSRCSNVRDFDGRLFAIRCFKSLRFEFLFFCSRYRETFPVILMEYATGFAGACCTQVLVEAL